MPQFGWTRLAYLLFVLVILTALVQLASLSADPRPLSSGQPDAVDPAVPQTTGENPHEPTRMAREPARTTQPTPTTRPTFVEDRLEDMAVPTPSARTPPARPPVFHRPAPANPPAGSARAPASAAGPVCGDLEGFPRSAKIVFPLSRAHFYSYEDTWGAPRPQGGHEGTDLMAPTGTPEYAVTDGTVVPVAGANQNGWNSLGGYAVMIEAAYSVGPIKKGDLFYYAHLERASALKIGTRVRAGQVVGYAGDTGQGPEVTRGLFPPHLHLGWYDATGSRSEIHSGAMNPYPLLEWIKANGGAVSGGSDARYCETPQTGAPVPSTGESRWPTPDSPGVRPDLNTGSDDPRPSPVLGRAKGRADHPVHEARKSPSQRADSGERRDRTTTEEAEAKEQRRPPKEKPEAKPPEARPPSPGTVPAERPVAPDPEPPPTTSGSSLEDPNSETAAGTGDDAPEDSQRPETDENTDGENGEDTPNERPEKPEKEDPDQTPRPPDEVTSSEEDPAGSEPETDEQETTGESEIDAESTVSEPVPETTELESTELETTESEANGLTPEATE